MPVHVCAVGRADLPPFSMPPRFRHDITYFCTPAGNAGAPQRLGEREYFVRLDDARQILDDGVIRIVSPLDSATTAEIEISEEQEDWLQWMIDNQIEHVRVE